MPDNSPYESTSLSVRSRIYRILYDTETFCSKQTLAGLCGVSMPTLYQNLNPLMEEGLVRYSGEGVSDERHRDLRSSRTPGFRSAFPSPSTICA